MKGRGAPVELNTIANKQVRARLFAKRRIEKKHTKREARKKRKELREQLGDKAPPIQEPRTQESTREPDVTTVQPDDEEVAEEEAADEFSACFRGDVQPKVLLTTGYGASRASFEFVSELMYLVPNVTYYRRRGYELAKVIQFSASRGFTDVLIVREDHGLLTSLVHAHLPDGPTAVYRLTSFMPSKRVRHHGRRTTHTPEVILNNFTTRLGHRVGRMLGALFPHTPELRGRQVVTVHNQRDFVFVRFHRYIFSEDARRARLQELGPRFTLRLRTLQRGRFQPTGGDYEWMHRKEMDTSRRRFFL